MRFQGPKIIRIRATTIVLAIASLASAQARDGDVARSSTSFTTEQVRFFENQVRPILKARCLKCHGEGPKVKGGFRLDSREAVLRGGDLGPAVSLQRARGEPAAPGDPLRRAGDAAGRQAAGGRDRHPDPVGQGRRALDRSSHDGFELDRRQSRAPAVARPKLAAANTWSHRPVVRPSVPAVKHRDWCRNPIDAFLLARLEAERLAAGARGRSRDPDPAASPTT